MNEFLRNLNSSRLAAYRACPRDILEHAGKEESVSAGGYGYRQILELVQNGADAILESRFQGLNQSIARIEVRLAGTFLYVANTGAPLSEEGLEALLSSDLSPKRGNQIGRFGLGFKSLLRLEGAIDIFSKLNGNIRFDPERCRRELRQEFGALKAPGLRMAWPLESNDCTPDQLLDSLNWAETIVRAEVRSIRIRDHLKTEIENFPREFLLFLDHPVEISLLIDSSPPIYIRSETVEDVKIIHSKGEQIRWKVFTDEVAITDNDAIVDATAIHARKSVPISWATPIGTKREEAGRFWAFFPTRTPTYLPGILNAPWKLNSDRNALIRGDWNNALMIEAARLVSSNLPKLASEDDPGRALDAFPRQPERQDEDAIPMLTAIWDSLSEARTIPDGLGVLRSPHELKRPPKDDTGLVRSWEELASREARADFVHASCLDGIRSKRLNALAERLNSSSPGANRVLLLERVSIDQWFSKIASTDIEIAIKVLKLAERFQRNCFRNEWAITYPFLSIIPTSEGDLATCRKVIFSPEGTRPPNGRKTVAAGLASNSEARKILKESFQVGELDDQMWMDVLRETMPTESFPGSWSDFWRNLRSAPQSVSGKFIEKHHGRILVCTRDGSWCPVTEVLLEGEIVRDDDEEQNPKILLHKREHSGDRNLLTQLGVSDYPEIEFTRWAFTDVIDEWLEFRRSTFLRNFTERPLPRRNLISPIGLTLPKAAWFLPHLKGPSNARLTAELWPLLGSCLRLCKFGHESMERYPKIEVLHPFPWLLLRYGEIQIADICVPLRAYVHRAAALVDSLSALTNQIRTLSKIELDRLLEITQPAVIVTPKDIQLFWEACIQAIVTPYRLRDDSLSPLWAAAAIDHFIPSSFQTAAKTLSLTDVFVTASSDLAKRVRSPERIVVTLDDSALKLWLKNGARNLSELVAPAWDSLSGPVMLLVDIVPEIGPILTDEARKNARCQPVTNLRLLVDISQEGIPCLIWEMVLLIDPLQYSSLSNIHNIEVLIQELAPASWLRHSPAEALRLIADATDHKKRASIRAELDLASRLLKATGGRVDLLKESMGSFGKHIFLTDCSPLKVSELVLAHHGPATLSAVESALAENGLSPPSRWNSDAARDFVASLGFPEIFASSADTRREAQETISGPIPLAPLHDFQELVFDGIKSLICSGAARRRGIVSLPTGGGKTRVMVEASVKLVLAPLGTRRVVIWIAQNDELCEQAVQAFRQVWVNLGAQRTDLRIVRLWGGNPNPAQNEEGKPLVIVASIQTLNARMAVAALSWLKDPGLVVVDECHHAITPSYTNLLRWLDSDAQKINNDSRKEPPILGLSATPFRMDDDESRRLAARFGNRWFPTDQEGLHSRLRAQGVLAEVDNEPLESGESLTEEEKFLFERYLPSAEGLEFERLIESLNQRLAGLEDRNLRILDCVRRSTANSIILFANSVNHAVELSARLNLIGIPSACVSGETPRVSRRYFLEKFKMGELRVLCNHSVLSTGFDAPKTDMLLIARQVFSPVRYMQIVGRGLRGEKNGGTKRCRIVTVLDNLGRYEDQHPYHYCARFFQETREL